MDQSMAQLLLAVLSNNTWAAHQSKAPVEPSIWLSIRSQYGASSWHSTQQTERQGHFDPPGPCVTPDRCHKTPIEPLLRKRLVDRALRLPPSRARTRRRTRSRSQLAPRPSAGHRYMLLAETRPHSTTPLSLLPYLAARHAATSSIGPSSICHTTAFYPRRALANASAFDSFLFRIAGVLAEHVRSRGKHSLVLPQGRILLDFFPNNNSDQHYRLQQSAVQSSFSHGKLEKASQFKCWGTCSIDGRVPQKRMLQWAGILLHDPGPPGVALARMRGAARFINARFLSRTCFAQYVRENGLRCAARRLPSAPEPQSNGSYTKIEYFAAGNFKQRPRLYQSQHNWASPSTKISAHITLDIARDGAVSTSQEALLTRAPFTTSPPDHPSDGYITDGGTNFQIRLMASRDPKEWYDGRQKTARWVSRTGQAPGGKQQVQPDSTRGRTSCTKRFVSPNWVQGFCTGVWHGIASAIMGLDWILQTPLSVETLHVMKEFFFLMSGLGTGPAKGDYGSCRIKATSMVPIALTLVPDLQAGIYFPIRRFFDDGGCDRRDETIWPATRCITVAKFPASFPTPILNDMYSKGQKEAQSRCSWRRWACEAVARSRQLVQTTAAGSMKITMALLAKLTQPAVDNICGRVPQPRPKSEDLLFDFVWVRSIAAYYLSTVCGAG
ncbi:uncharacterized protein CLUP02_10865 [Colletotrichum lupini]|uniref:Uncharacterized protein n=1 Tax=Colletotrichum lupini TaxID=145971 RepID=A0A9Q8SY44_9PEZI|nr:uncharacterized protein CLUP02_10865 [Colletotrichum lupini]UQC85368.1 hypothetical protein CLUP02_10865 [Colletotrichum lupini]